MAIGFSTSAIDSLSTQGPHGLTEFVYAFTSAAANNGSSFAGINADTFFYNSSLSVVMLIGRFAILVPSLALAGNLAAKKKIPQTVGLFQRIHFYLGLFF